MSAFGGKADMRPVAAGIDGINVTATGDAKSAVHNTTISIDVRHYEK